MKPLTNEWIEKADGDFNTAERELRAVEHVALDAIVEQLEVDRRDLLQQRLLPRFRQLVVEGKQVSLAVRVQSLSDRVEFGHGAFLIAAVKAAAESTRKPRPHPTRCQSPWRPQANAPAALPAGPLP